MCSSSHQKEASVSRNRTWRVVVFDKEYSCARHVHFWRGGTSNAEVKQRFKTWMASSLLIFFPRLNFFRQISVARIVIFSFLFFFSKNICGLLSQHLAGGMTLLCDLFLRTAYISIFQYVQSILSLLHRQFFNWESLPTCSSILFSTYNHQDWEIEAKKHDIKTTMSSMKQLWWVLQYINEHI